MKIIVEKKPLLGLLNHVVSLVERRTTIPILQNLLIEAKSGHISLSGTDLERHVTSGMEADVTAPFSTTVPAHMFADLVKRAPDGSQISLEYDASKSVLIVKAGRMRASLATLAATDFPTLSEQRDTPATFEMPADQLRDIITTTGFAISTEETRYYLNGTFLHIHEPSVSEPRMLRGVATDGHRMACVEVPAPEGLLLPEGVIVPRKTCHELGKLLGDAKGETITVSISKARLTVSVGATSIATKLIDGTFPDYQRVIPQHNSKTLRIASGMLGAAIDRVLVVNSERGSLVALDVGPEVKISCRDPQGFSVEDVIDAAEFDGDPIRIGFNGRYLRDILDQCGSTVEVKFGTPGDPTIFKSAEQSDRFFICMPMRT